MFDINSEVVSDSIFAKKRRLTDQNPTLNSPFLRHLSNYYKNSRKGLRICAIAQVYTTRVICVFSKMNDTTGRDHVETTKCKSLINASSKTAFSRREAALFMCFSPRDTCSKPVMFSKFNQKIDHPLDAFLLVIRLLDTKFQ